MPTIDAVYFYSRSPYKEAFDIDFPQESLETDMYKHRCLFCKVLTTEINGFLENHKADCEYRLSKLPRI